MVRLLVPRVRSNEAFDNPSVKPSGEKVNRRVGPGRLTPEAAGPAASQSGTVLSRGAMLSAAESTESVSTWPRAMDMTRARW
jgi:hypothetical protein